MHRVGIADCAINGDALRPLSRRSWSGVSLNPDTGGASRNRPPAGSIRTTLRRQGAIPQNLDGDSGWPRAPPPRVRPSAALRWQSKRSETIGPHTSGPQCNGGRQEAALLDREECEPLRDNDRGEAVLRLDMPHRARGRTGCRDTEGRALRPVCRCHLHHTQTDVKWPLPPRHAPLNARSTTQPRATCHCLCEHRTRSRQKPSNRVAINQRREQCLKVRNALLPRVRDRRR